MFAVSNKVAGLVALVISSFSLAWFPYAMQIKESPTAKHVYAEMFSYYIGAATVLVNAIAVYRTEIIGVFAPAYGEASHTIAILCVYYVVAGSVYVLTLGLHITEETKYILGPGVASVAVNAVASAGLVQAMGLEGIAYGSLLGGLVWVVLQVRKAQRLYRIPFRYSFCVNATILTTVTIYGGPYLDAALRGTPGVVTMGAKLFVLWSTLVIAYLAYSAERRRCRVRVVPVPMS
jgi:O-antigen/teichoic acid export membrane protein